MKDIQQIEDIHLLVDTFYGKIRSDDLLAEIFEEVVQNNWTPHLEKMYGFWQTVLLGELAYRGSPFLPHMNLPVEKQHFDRWLSLFFETVDSLFTGEKAEEAKWRANRMADMFYSKIRYYRNQSATPLI